MAALSRAIQCRVRREKIEREQQSFKRTQLQWKEQYVETQRRVEEVGGSRKHPKFIPSTRHMVVFVLCRDASRVSRVVLLHSTDQALRFQPSQGLNTTNAAALPGFLYVQVPDKHINIVEPTGEAIVPGNGPSKRQGSFACEADKVKAKTGCSQLQNVANTSGRVTNHPGEPAKREKLE